jgi:hypothetical protein
MDFFQPPVLKIRTQTFGDSFGLRNVAFLLIILRNIMFILIGLQKLCFVDHSTKRSVLLIGLRNIDF